LFGWSQSLWIAHFRTVSRGVISQKGFEEWKSFRELFQNGVIPWTGISLLLMLIIAGAIGLLYIQRLTSNNRLIFNLVIAGGTMSLISLISHLIGVNPQITSFWYFYFNFTSWLLIFTSTCMILSEKSKYALEIFLKCFLFLELVLAILIADYQRPKISILIITFLIIMSAIIKFRQHIGLKEFLVACFVSFSAILTFLSPSFANVYIPNNLKDVTNFYIDQKLLITKVFQLPLEKKSLATWSETDTSGFAGGELSTLTYHLTRLEGLDIQSNKINPEFWRARNGALPKHIVVFLKTNSDYFTKNKLPAQYIIEEKMMMPSGKVELLILRLKNFEARNGL
jgi:hypothetical protein